MALKTLEPGTVTLLAEAANNFRVENLSPQGIRVCYADSAPADIEDDWGTLPTGNIEIRVVDGDLYGYSTKRAFVSVFESPIPA